MIDLILKIKAFFIGIFPHWTVVVDTETTGLYNAELLQVSLITASGRVLFNKYVKPESVDSWPDAQKVNHISPRMVKHRLHFSSYLPVVNAYLRHTKHLIGYNVKGFDLPLLESYGVSTSAEVVDIMLDDNDRISKPGKRREQWRKLVVVARHYGYLFSGHDSLEDCFATAHINAFMHPGITTIFYFLRRVIRVGFGALIIGGLIPYYEMLGYSEISISTFPYVVIMCIAYVYGPVSATLSSLIGVLVLEAPINCIIAVILSLGMG